jgi:hypothetical protein
MLPLAVRSAAGENADVHLTDLTGVSGSNSGRRNKTHLFGLSHAGANISGAPNYVLLLLCFCLQHHFILYKKTNF